MKILNSTVDYVVDNSLCLSCGVCEDSCTANAIKLIESDGLILPEIDKSLCLNKKGCNICYQVCPGKGIDLQNRSDKLFRENGSKKDKYIGNYHSCYSGFSNNYEIRFHSASGGILSQFLIYLIEKKIIQGAVITRYKKDKAHFPESFIATTKEEILSGKSSKYCPVSLAGMAREIQKQIGLFIIVGLPCHIEGFRLLEERYRNFGKKIFGYFAVYCSATQTFNSQEYLFGKYFIKKDELKSFTYRDDGCLGSLKAILKNDKVIKVPFLDYYYQLRSFFKPHRCSLCPDLYGDLADVSFGDIYTGEYKTDKIGVNSIIVRSKKFNNLMKQALADGCITLNEIDPKLVNKSQPMLIHDKHITKYYLQIEQLMGRTIPKYDIVFGDYNIVRALVSYLALHIQQNIGKHPSLWFLIDFVGFLMRQKRKYSPH